MKKLMVAAFAAIVAVASQAAALNWSSGKVVLDDGTGKGWSGTGAVLPKSNSDYTMTVLLYSSYDDGALSGLLGTGDHTGTGTKSTIGGTTSKSGGDFAQNTKYYAQATLENTATGAKLMSQILEFEWDGASYEPKIDFMAEAGAQGILADTLVSKNGEFSATTGWWQASGWTSAVPEPTSGLLLLLGVAGLALRRRRA